MKSKTRDYKRTFCVGGLGGEAFSLQYFIGQWLLERVEDENVSKEETVEKRVLWHWLSLEVDNCTLLVAF